MNPCPYCGTLMTSPRRKQCGAPECKRLFRNERMRDYQRAYKEQHGHYQTRLYDRPRVKEYPVHCAHCGVDTVVTKAEAKYCSHSCWYEASHARHAQVELAWKPLLRAPRLSTVTLLRPLRRRWFSTCCPMCSTWFVTDNPRDQNCSRRCGRRAAKDRRRALERDAFVEHVSRPEVYERDQWTCQLCGEAVLRDEVVPHPQAPTLDHVIPLARGGTHEPANVQLAHYICNSTKTYRLELDEQTLDRLRLQVGHIGALSPSPRSFSSGPYST
ncbi:HNH endonuclease [Streptomyces sp. NPDC001652]|uniref:HNH endonuclease n=1 Tax=Streptomyces sp. NPDC001652 TaxID=3154393 RepID=UPI003330DE24